MKRANSETEMDVTIEEKISVKKNELRVMLLGKLENPKIECPKELYHNESESKIISLGVKRSQAAQKFRIPFKNTCPTQDADIEFTFVKLPPSSGYQEEEEDKALDPLQYLEFYCQPNLLKIGAGSQGILNVLIKVNTQKLSGQEMSRKALKRPINKLLVARLKDSSLLFSFFVSISIISQ